MKCTIMGYEVQGDLFNNWMEMEKELQAKDEQYFLIRDHNKKLCDENERLNEQLKVLEEALEFYANTLNYEYAGEKFFGGYARPAIKVEFEDVEHVNNDEWILYGGKRARQALNTLKTMRG